MAAKSYYDCIGVIQKAAGEGAISQEQAKNILDEIDKISETKFKEGGIAASEQLILDELDRVTNAIKEAALIEKRNALINASKFKDVMAYAKKWSNPGEALRAYLVG